MSATRPPARSGPTPFQNITPGGIAADREEAVWAAATLGGVLFLAVVSAEAHSILRFSAATGKWETVHHKTTQRTRAGGGAELTETALSALLFAHRSKTGEALYARLISPCETENLRSNQDGSSFEVTRSHFEDFQDAAASGRRSQGAKCAIRLEGDSLSICSLNQPGVCKAIALPAIPATARFSQAVSWNNLLTVAADDPARGCSLWNSPVADSAQPNWAQSLSRGGHRFSANAEVLALTTWKNALYLACGRSGECEKNPSGFELLRVYPDGSWDLLAGTPRVTDTGLKIPLAGFGPGLNEFEPSRFCFLTATGNQLVLGTYHEFAGFRIWRSTEGEAWAAGEAELVGMDRVRGATALPLGDGLALFLELYSPLRGKTFNLWLGA